LARHINVELLTETYSLLLLHKPAQNQNITEIRKETTFPHSLRILTHVAISRVRLVFVTNFNCIQSLILIQNYCPGETLNFKVVSFFKGENWSCSISPRITRINLQEVTNRPIPRRDTFEGRLKVGFLNLFLGPLTIFLLLLEKKRSLNLKFLL